MPQRAPNQLLGKAADPYDRGGHPSCFVDSASESSSAEVQERRSEHDTLSAAKREIRRLREAIKSLEACVKPKSADTSLAWKAEAEKVRAELATCKADQNQLLEELSTARDALAQRIAQGQEDKRRAVDKEGRKWKDRLEAACKEAEEARRELQQTHGRLEEAEMSKTRALFELAAERSRERAASIDPGVHETTLEELQATRKRLTDKESEAARHRETTKAEADAHQAELQQNISYLRRVVKEQKLELAAAREASVEADTKLTKLLADHKRLLAEAEVLQQESTMLQTLQRQWEVWSQEAEEAILRTAKDGCSGSQELCDLRQKLKAAEERAERSAADATRRVSQLSARLPKPRSQARVER